MRQNVFLKLFTLILMVLSLLAVNCGRSGNLPGKEVAQKLIDYLNSRLPGSKFNINLYNSMVTPLEKNRYKVVFKNFSFTSDLAQLVHFVNKNFSQKDNPCPDLNTVQMEETEIVYGPDDNYLSLRSLKGMSLEYDIKESQEQNSLSGSLGFNMDKIRISIGKITFRELDIDELIKSGNNQFTEVTTGLGEGISRPFESELEHLEIGLTGTTRNNDNILVLLDIEKIGQVDSGREAGDISDSLLDKDAPPPDLNKLLETGTAINDLNIHLGKVNISIKKNGAPLCGGVIESATYSQFMKPDETRKSFKFGNGLQLKNLRFSIPGKQELELLSNVKEFRWEFSIKPLSPGATLVFLELLNKGFILRNQVDSTKMKEYAPLVTKFMFEVMKSKTHIRFSISPLKHYFGDINAVADIRLYNLMMGPVVKITVTLCKVDEILNKLKEANVFPPSTLETISDTIARYAVKQENGDASFIHKMDITQLQQMMLRVNPIAAPTTSHITGNSLQH